MAFHFRQRGRGRTVRHVPGTMNKTEAAYSTLLRSRIASGELLWCEFESVTLKLAKDTRYTPDFIVQPADGSIEFHEVKARRKGKDGNPDRPLIEDDAHVKIKCAAAMFPFKFVIVYPNGLGGWTEKEVEAA